MQEYCKQTNFTNLYMKTQNQKSLSFSSSSKSHYKAWFSMLSNLRRPINSIWNIKLLSDIFANPWRLSARTWNTMWGYEHVQHETHANENVAVRLFLACGLRHSIAHTGAWNIQTRNLFAYWLTDAISIIAMINRGDSRGHSRALNPIKLAFALSAAIIIWLDARPCFSAK
jgi:hypothetical protein